MKQIFLIILTFVFLGCSSSLKSVKEKKCLKIYINDYTQILNEKYETIINNDTIRYNEIRFDCVYSSFYTKKIMFDKFGKWDKVIYPSNKEHPILLWEKVDLYSNGKKYNVYANGDEHKYEIYASIMIFDENGIDILSKDSSETENLTKYFSNLIKKNDTTKTDFYEIYWKMVAPKRMEKFNDKKNH